MSPPDPAPEHFGRYLLVHKLAEGGMAEIWFAKQVGPEGFEKIVVLKRVLPHLMGNREFLNMFMDEARIAARLQHPNIVQIHDFGVEGGRHFLAMEYLPGEDGSAIIYQSIQKKSPVPVAVAAKIVSGACEGLHFAHDFAGPDGVPLGLVHRDISPTNVFVTYQGAVKVLDFGIAKIRNKLTHTRAGTLKGKFSYMSPEQASGEELDRRSDVFALGIVLFELLTGLRLFHRNSELAILKAIIDEPIRPIRQVRPDVPEEVEAIVFKSLAKRKEDRYQSAEDLQKALESYLGAHTYIPSQAHLTSFMAGLFGEERKRERLKSPLATHTPLPNTATPPPSSGVDIELDSLLGGATGVVQTPAPQPVSRTSFDISVEELARPGTGVQGRTAVVPHSGLGTPPPVAVGSLPQPLAQAPVPPKTEVAGSKALLLVVAGVVVVAAIGGAAFFLRQSASNVVGPPVRPPVANPQTPGTSVMGGLVVNSDPLGAVVMIDGKVMGTTPATIEKLEADREVQIRLEFAGYVPATGSAKVEAGKVSVVQYKLQKSRGVLVLSGVAETAQVFLDGEAMGAGASRLEGAPGAHQLRVVQRGYEPFTTSVTLLAGEEKSLAVALQKSRGTAPARSLAPGAVLVSCTPWCRIFLDGQDTGKVSPITLPVPAGNHQLRLVNPPSGLEKTVSITVGENETVRQVVSLR